jgi:hypothetical protein
LRQWAKGGDIILARYFSWNPGSDKLQKSQLGLLRTLLYESLSSHEELIPVVFPGRWFLLECFGKQVALPELKINQLHAAFRALLAATGNSLKMFLLIDGLDEFEGDHTQLVRLIREAHENPAVKVCVSSRPWNVFKDEYQLNPMLRLEALTLDDIELFVGENLAQTPGFDDFRITNPVLAANILSELVNKAQGVFLWVSVVSEVLKRLFREGCSAERLQSVIESLPREVSDLFGYIWDRVEPDFRPDGLQYLWLMRSCMAWNIIPHCLTFWLGNNDVPVSIPKSEMTGKYFSSAVATLGRILASRTGGLLEIGQSAQMYNKRVEYIHRTAHDWVEDNWANIEPPRDDKFDPALGILKGEILRIMFIWERSEDILQNLSKKRLVLFELASRADDTPFKRTLLGKVLDRYGESVKQYFPDNSILGTAAQYIVVPYLKLKATEEPTAFSAKKSSVGFLEYLIFGPYGYLTVYGVVAGIPHGDLQRRLDMIDYLLTSKVCLESVQHTRKIVRAARDDPVCRREQKEALAATKSNVRPEYYASVLAILDRHNEISQPRKESSPGKKVKRVTHYTRKLLK